MGVAPKIGRLTIYGGELTGMCKLYFETFAFYVPHLPSHAICIFSVEYTYPHIDWASVGGGGGGCEPL